MPTYLSSALTLSNDAAVGTAAWSNPTNASSSNDSYATCSLGASEQSNYLKGLNPGFPAIRPTGISASFERKCNTANFVVDVIVKLVVGGSVVGTNKSAGAGWPNSDATATFSWSDAELVSLGVTSSVVSASDFGVVISASADPLDTASVDLVSMTMTTAPGPVSGASYAMSRRLVHFKGYY